MRTATRTALMLALSAFAAPLAAQPAADKPAAKEEASPANIPPPTVSVTRHSGTFGGQRINYAATIGETLLKNKDGVPDAAIVTTAYIKEPRDPSRPATFLFNGGPVLVSLQAKPRPADFHPHPLA